MQGDNLSVFLFLASLAVTFGVAGVSQAGWRHRALIGSLFLIAGFFLVAAVSWPWVKDRVPYLRELISHLAESPVAWFAVLMLAMACVLARRPAPAGLQPTLLGSGEVSTPAESSAAGAGKVATTLKIQFGLPGSGPLMISEQNIWRWYALEFQIPVLQSNELNIVSGPTALFVTFAETVAFKQIVLDGNGSQVPSHEIKDHSGRHTVIVFHQTPTQIMITLSLML